jgi:hypothetical protein
LPPELQLAFLVMAMDDEQDSAGADDQSSSSDSGQGGSGSDSIAPKKPPIWNTEIREDDFGPHKQL